MKKADPFSGIPAVPISLAGQWLAFNHMANHYRKLLNVKPRVDSAAPRISNVRSNPSLYGQLNLLAQPTTAKPKKKVKKSIGGSTTLTAINTPDSTNRRGGQPPSRKVTSAGHESSICSEFIQIVDVETDTETAQSSPRTPLVKKRQVNKQTPDPSSASQKKYTKKYSSQGALLDYQVVFGPSSLKSSTDALESDCESQPEKPRVESIGVAEKILMFLDQMHTYNAELHLDTQQKLLLKPTPRKSMGFLSSNKYPQQLTLDSNNNRRASISKKLIPAEKAAPKTAKPPNATATKASNTKSRHSNCFLPSSTLTSPQIVRKKPFDNNTAVGLAKKAQPKLSDAISRAKFARSGTTNPNNLMQSKSKGFLERNYPGRAEKEFAARNVPNPNKKRYLSGGSSVGTIRGSDDLTAEDLLLIPNPMSHRHNPQKVDSPRSATVKALTPKTRHKSGIIHTATSSNSNGYYTQSAMSKATSMSSLGIINTKDSSRDSAYGFSSGESRVTSTRESTPEKSKNYQNPSHCKLKARKSSSGEKHYKSSSAAKTSSTHFNPSETTNDKDNAGLNEKKKAKQSSEDIYLNFLTEITEDIVGRGIYTNKGLKLLFKAHMDSHEGLDLNRMDKMLEKLRMDLGIPKDDTLNKLEFGYGSVVYTTDSYNYHNRNKDNPPIPEVSSPSTSAHEMSPSGKNTHLSAVRIPPSRTRVLTLPYPASGSNSSSDQQGFFSSEEGHSSKSETVLSETELRRTLKEVGIDSETTLEIVEIINGNHNHRTSTTDASDNPSSSSLKKSKINFEDKHSRVRDSFHSPPRSHSSRCGSTTGGSS